MTHTIRACTCGDFADLSCGKASTLAAMVQQWDLRHTGEGHEPCSLKRAQENAQKQREAGLDA